MTAGVVVLGWAVPIVLAAIGVWGFIKAPAMTRYPGMNEDKVAKRRRVLRRGALTCVAVGILHFVTARLGQA
jgi:uncharacterized membrane protein YdbT with pleckstrin-like domain